MSFAHAQLEAINRNIEAGLTTSVIGIPGCGISVFMKQLALQPFGKMIYVDVFSLPALTGQEFFANLLEQLGGNSHSKNTLELVHGCLDQLKELIKQPEKIVFVISGFDKLAGDFSADFFRYVRSLRSVDQSKVIFVFGICRRLEVILPSELTNLDLRLFSNVYHLKRYSESDLRFLLDTYGPKITVDDKTFQQFVKLSGGHFQFLQLLLQSEYRQSPTDDPFIKLCFENIWSHFSTSQKATVRKLAMDGKLTKVDDYLTNVGIVTKVDDGYQFFSPLFADCVRAFSAPKLPIKERRLLAVLKKNQGHIVSKRDIYDAIWHGDEIGSEWALNALMYRLRKHPAFIAQRYTIENNKKLGYTLTKS